MLKYLIREQTVADAILDRIVLESHRLELKGESMRKKRQLKKEAIPETQDKSR